MNEWDEEEVTQIPKGLGLQMPEKTTIVDEEKSGELTFNLGEETLTDFKEETKEQIETPLTDKEEGFMKIEALLSSGEITEAQAEEYFTQISAGEIEKVLQALSIR